ncbi:cyclic nucleotide-binding domain-containing protein [Rhodoligotrophos ferricapiens]|uniref:cyclic nucleotide-binding domain-containing protein n=1 Tax=Rhodoligotrophos ferricapiens TaxID=3069264 RepID=UPI00315D6666
MSVRSRVELLRRIPVFAEAADAHLQLLAFAMETESFQPGQALITRGDHSQTAYIIETGSARVADPQETGGDPMLVGPGACIGECSMVAGLPYSITVVASTEVKCLKLTRQLFYRVAEEFPDFAEIVLAAITQRVDETVNELRAIERLFRQARSFSA